MPQTNLELSGAILRTQSGNVDYWYGGGSSAWASLAAAKAGVPSAIRPGKTVGVIVGGLIVEYWWPNPGAIADGNLVIKGAAGGVAIVRITRDDLIALRDASNLSTELWYYITDAVEDSNPIMVVATAAGVLGNMGLTPATGFIGTYDIDTDVFTASGGGSGISSIQEGDDISIDATDPENPIISVDSASAATWNGKQDAITTGLTTQYLRGDLSLSTFLSDVLSSLLTGLSITGSTIASTDTILQAFGKVQNQINALVGGVLYKGTWNASTNTPTLSDGTGVQGNYYVVSVAGSQNLGSGSISFAVGDWAIYNGTIWEKVDNTDAVVSVFGRIGAVVATNGDYNTDQVTEATNLYFTTSRVLATVLTGYVSGAGTISATDTVLQAIQKLDGNVAGKQAALGFTPENEANKKGTVAASSTDYPSMDAVLGAFQKLPIIVSSNITAANDQFYIVTANATYTDPTPVEGKGFSVLVRNGTATIGGTGYSTAGTLVFRVYHSGAWANYAFYSGVKVASVSGLTVDNTTPTAPVIKPVYSFFNGAPGTSQDNTQGYIANQSRVVDYNTQIQYLCTDASTDAAVWQAQSGEAGGDWVLNAVGDSGFVGIVSGVWGTFFVKAKMCYVDVCVNVNDVPSAGGYIFFDLPIEPRTGVVIDQTNTMLSITSENSQNSIKESFVVSYATPQIKLQIDQSPYRQLNNTYIRVVYPID